MGSDWLYFGGVGSLIESDNVSEVLLIVIVNASKKVVIAGVGDEYASDRFDFDVFLSGSDNVVDDEK